MLFHLGVTKKKRRSMEPRAQIEPLFVLTNNLSAHIRSYALRVFRDDSSAPNLTALLT